MNEHSFIFAAMRERDDHKMRAIRSKAIEMIVARGFDGFSMQKLAKAAGVSPATLYIYYKDREDLILQVWVDSFREMGAASLQHFDPAMPFSEGLRVQWINRARYYLKYPQQMQFMEQLRHSPLQEKALELMDPSFRQTMQSFVANAIKKNELVKLQLEVYWSIAFAPLYNLVKFHLEGKNMAGQKFVLTNKTMNEALQLVLKALRPEG